MSVGLAAHGGVAGGSCLLACHQYPRFRAARQTLRQIRHIEVTRLTGRFEADERLIYQTTVKLAFHVERAEDDEPLALQQAVEIATEEPLA